MKRTYLPHQPVFEIRWAQRMPCLPLCHQIAVYLHRYHNIFSEYCSWEWSVVRQPGHHHHPQENGSDIEVAWALTLDSSLFTGCAQFIRSSSFQIVFFVLFAIQTRDMLLVPVFLKTAHSSLEFSTSQLGMRYLVQRTGKDCRHSMFTGLLQSLVVATIDASCWRVSVILSSLTRTNATSSYKIIFTHLIRNCRHGIFSKVIDSLRPGISVFKSQLVTCFRMSCLIKQLLKTVIYMFSQAIPQKPVWPQCLKPVITSDGLRRKQLHFSFLPGSA